MKFKKLALSFLYLFIGIATCSFTQNNVDINEYQVNANSVNFLSEDEIDNQLGTLNTDLEVQLRSWATTDLSSSFQVLIEFSDSANLNNNYYVGYWGEGENYLPASLAFYVKQTDGQVVRRTSPLKKVQGNNNYDGVGSSLGANSLNTFCDIDIAKGEEVLMDKGIQLFNVFLYDVETKTYDLSKPTYIDCNPDYINTSTYKPIYDQSNFFELNYVGKSNYSGYSTFSFDVENYGLELYPTLNSTTSRAYRQNEDAINKGELYIRSVLSFGGSTEFVITFDDGRVERYDSTSKAHEITHNQQLILLFEGIDADEVVDVEIYDLYYQLSIYNPDTGQTLNRTSFSQRFGRIYTGMTDLLDSSGQIVREKNNHLFSLNYDAIVGLSFGISTLIFLGIVIPSYFYLKKKNRNDEFKRMNTKSYVSTAIMGYLTIESVLLLILFILIRTTSFNNSLTVFNPTDVYIIVLGVASIILVGYFIRYFIIMIKNNAEKRRRDRLNINHDVIDDGTLIIRK